MMRSPPCAAELRRFFFAGIGSPFDFRSILYDHLLRCVPLRDRMTPDESSKHLQGITDLTLLAPIKQGLIEGLDTRTYKSRLKLLLKTLNALRSSSREYALIHPFSDSAERIRTIHSLRLAIFEPEDKLLLAVTFDRPWEPYIRIIWRDVGTLLDVIFCNCE